ncbi:ferric-mycobactin receptor FemA [Oxalicibacterium flavum]|uniref:Ferric-mycobactin receptor FemA n=1 Tax=Oxalicibacterium flavum TaxID=179467 RepID=A0A8J2XWY9_9BURK|nr:TonB-dependent receptor [Oxalicibacterium flavum]GGC02768.1 ferric-mycobactin receptor FemA [Oxalicibacterium flavum]
MKDAILRPAPLALLIALAFGSGALHAQPAAAPANSIQISINAQPLAEALNDWARQTRIQLVVEQSLVAGKTAPAVNGNLTPRQALDRLLAGSGLAAIDDTGGAIVIRAIPSAGQEATLPAVKVMAETMLPAAYAGGQVARGGRVGMLGNRDMLDTPFSTTQYTAQLAEDQQAQTIGDVLVNDPSVRNTYARSAGREEFNIRGFTLFNYDVSYNGLYGLSPRNAASLIGVERVEVLRGPSALLNGMAPAGSVGGGINLVPKRAGADPLTRLTLSYLDDGQFGAHADVSRRFGNEQQWGVRFNAAKRSGDTPVNGSSERVDALALGLDYQGERVRLEADLNYQDRVTHGRSSLLFPPASGTPIAAAPDNKLNFQPKWSYWEAKERAAVVRGEVDIAPGLVAYGALGAMQYDFDSLQTTSLLQDAQGNLLVRPYRLKEYVDTRTIEAGLRGRFETGKLHHEVVVSATSYAQDNGLLRQNDAISPSSIYTPADIAFPNITLGGSIPRTSETRMRSLAFADTISSADRRIQLTLGARHQEVRTRTLDPDTGAQSARYDKSAVTPMASLLFKATEGVSLYGNYIEGLSQGPTAPSGTSNMGQMFPPSKSKQVEIGAKYDTGRFATTVSLFQIERPSSVLDAATAPPTFRMDGQQRNRGLEIISQGEVTSGVRLLTGMAYTQGKLVKTEGGANDGRTAPATPRLQINLGGEWDTSFLPGLTLTARGLRTSSQYVDMANTQQLPSWTRWDIGARYRFNAGGRPVTLRASIENVLDRDFWQSAAREGLTMGAPRTLLVSVSTDF